MCRKLTAHQKRRIRQADAATLGRMVDQEAYWHEDALLRILDRVEILAHESPTDAEQGARYALQILARNLDAGPELKALALAVHGTTLRYLGRYGEAIQLYTTALELPGLNTRGRCNVLKRQTAALVLSGREEEGLASIEEALSLQPGDETNLAVRAWALVMIGDYQRALEDCSEVLERADVRKTPRSFLGGIVSTATVLRFEGFPVAPPLVQRTREAIEQCRQSIPRSGSSFYSLTLVRAFLYRAEALLLSHEGEHREAAKLLRRSLDKLSTCYPDDAFFTAVDLVCAYVRSGQGRRAVNVCRLILELSEELPFKIQFEGLVMARYAVERGSVNEAQAVELRALLRRV